MRPTYDTSDPIEYIKSNLTMLIDTRVLFGMERIQTDTEEFIEKAVRERDMVYSIQSFFKMNDDGSYTIDVLVQEKEDSTTLKSLRWVVLSYPTLFSEWDNKI